MVAAGLVAAACVAGGVACNRGETPVFAVDSAVVHIDRQLALGPRVAGSAARDSCARYIARTLERYGAAVRVQPFDVKDPYGERTIRMMNVIGSFGAGEKRRLMLCSHYDSRPWADQEKDSTLWTTPILGAVDGATSTAILLEVARLAGSRAPQNIGVDLVFFDGEDYGKEGDIDYYLLGSRHFAANLEDYRPVAAVLLDMVGGAGTTARREGTSDERSRALMDYVFARAQALDLRYFQNLTQQQAARQLGVGRADWQRAPLDPPAGQASRCGGLAAVAAALNRKPDGRRLSPPAPVQRSCERERYEPQRHIDVAGPAQRLGDAPVEPSELPEVPGSDRTCGA